MSIVTQRRTTFVVFLLLLALCALSRRPVLANEPLHMFYAELSLCTLREGLTVKSLVPVPMPGEHVVDPAAFAAALELQLVVVDGELAAVAVRSRSGHLPPLRLVISPSPAEEDAEASAVFAVSSQHSLSQDVVEFTVQPPLHLRLMTEACQQFVRLDTFSRRMLIFEYELLQHVALTSAGLTVTYVPHNSSMGVRFRVLLHAPAADRWKMQITLLRKPPIPPVKVFLLAKLSPTSRGEYLLGHGGDESPSPRGYTVDDALANVTTEQMAAMITGRSEMVFVLRVAFEELHRACYGEYRLKRVNEELRAVSQYHQMDKELHAVDTGVPWPHRCTLNGGSRPSDLVRLRLFFSAASQAISLHVIQPFPIMNLQIHAVDGANATIFLEEEHWVEFVSMHDTSMLPFGWQDVFEKNTTVAWGDTISFYVYFDERQLPADDHVIATGASAMLHPSIRSRVTRQDRHDSLGRWIALHGGWMAGSVCLGHQQHRAFLEAPARAIARGNVAISIPRELLFTEVHAMAVPFIRQLFTSEQWNELVEDLSDLLDPRDIKVLLLTLFSLTHPESPEGIKWHLFISTLPQVGPTGLLGGVGLNVAQHHEFVAGSLELCKLFGVARAVRRRRTMLEEVFKFVSSQWPWLIKPPIDVDFFVERFTAVDGTALQSANDVLFIAPGIHLCTFSDGPMTELLFNKANDSVELRFVRGSSWGGDGSGAKESMPVTCDLFQLLSGAPYWNAVENFLRRGFIPLRAEPVAHLSLHSTDEDMSGAMIFSLTKSKQSRAPVLDALASFAAPCAGSTASRPSFPCLRLFRGLVEEHLAGLPVILETPVRTDADRLVASHVTSMMSVLLRGARDVLTTHLEHLADEHVTDRLQEDRSPKAVSPEVSLNLDERELL